MPGWALNSVLWPSFTSAQSPAGTRRKTVLALLWVYGLGPLLPSDATGRDQLGVILGAYEHCHALLLNTDAAQRREAAVRVVELGDRASRAEAFACVLQGAGNAHLAQAALSFLEGRE